MAGSRQMKTKLYVPLKLNTVNNATRPEYMRLLREAGADFVFFALERTFDNGEEEKAQIAALKRETIIFEKEGFETGVWLQAFGFGTPLPKKDLPLTESFVRIHDVEGYCSENSDAFCPTDKRYTELMCGKMKNLAAAGVRLIMLDDDLCLCIRPGIGCGCKEHMRLFRERMKEGVPCRSELLKKIISGPPNILRTEWLKLMGETLQSFCAQMRRAVDSVDSSVRLGFCAGFTSWDIEGADAILLTKILAGHTKPFLRLSGAPYWIATNRFAGQDLQEIIEFVRRQQAWCEGAGIEVFHEADSYPRPRHNVPASYLELYDICLRFSGGMDAMKYMFDYFSAPGYERGYLNAHQRSRGLYDWIDRECSGMETAGIQIADKMHKVCDMTIPPIYGKKDARLHFMETAFSKTHILFTRNGIPTAYKRTNGLSAAFGEDAKYLENADMQKGVFLDARAAFLLQQQGKDVGIITWEKAAPQFEVFGEGEKVHLDFSSGFYFKLSLKKQAKVLSVFTDEEESYPACYYYENSRAQKFIVFAFDGTSIDCRGTTVCSYYRQRQLFHAVRLLGGRTLFEYSGTPGIYALCKEDDRRAVILLANIFQDAAANLVLELNGHFEKCSFINGNGRLSGQKLQIDSIQPFTAMGIELIKTIKKI